MAKPVYSKDDHIRALDDGSAPQHPQAVEALKGATKRCKRLGLWLYKNAKEAFDLDYELSLKGGN